MSMVITTVPMIVTDYNSQIQAKIENARIEAKTLYTEVELQKRKVRDVVLSDQSSRIASIPNHSVNPKLYNSLEGHQNKISKIQWNSTSDQILSASQDGYMILWDSVTGLKKNAIELGNQWVLTCSLSPNGQHIASGGLDNNLTIYSINQGGRARFFDSTIRHIFKSHRAYISDCQFLNDQQLLSISGDMKGILWDMNKGDKVRDFIEHTGDILCMDTFGNNVKGTQFSNNLFISGSCDGYCKIWDLRSKTAVQSLFISNYDINSVRIFPQGQSFITGSDDGVIRMFDLRSDCEISHYSILSQLQDQKRQSIQMDSVNILSVDFSKSGRLIYSCYSDFGCLIWDTLKNEVCGSIGGHLNKINQVSVSPDGVGICTGSWDTMIKVWAQ